MGPWPNGSGSGLIIRGETLSRFDSCRAHHYRSATLQTELIIEYRHSRFPQAAELEIENVFRIPGDASRETWSFDAHRCEEIGIFEPFVICPHAPRGLSRLADCVGAN